MFRTEDRYVRMRCTNSHERTIGFYELEEEGKPVRHMAYVRAALQEVFPSYEGVWRDDGELPRCPCGAGFVERVS